MEQADSCGKEDCNGGVWRPRGRSHLAGNVECVDGSRSDHGCPGDCSETSRVAPLQPLTILSCPSQCQFLPSSRPQSAVTPPLGSPPFHYCSGPFFPVSFPLSPPLVPQVFVATGPSPSCELPSLPTTVALPPFRNAFSAQSSCSSSRASPRSLFLVTASGC